jgi:serine/threonine-protein kinase mTOR
LQFDPESSPELTLYHAHPQVALAYLKYQYAVGDELKRRDAFSKLQVSLFLPMYFDGTLQCA